jgi:hypothetical protein
VPAARVLVILACTCLCGARGRAQPAAPPKILLLVRQQFKPGQIQVRERLERATSAVYNHLEVPVYWMEMQAFTGTPEALLFAPYESFEAIEKALPVVSPLQEAHPELFRWQDGINDALSSERTILAVRRDTPGVDRINLAQARFLRMLVVRPGPGEDAPMLDNAAVYQVNSGMPEPAFLIFQAMAEFADISPAQVSGTIVEDSVYAIEPDLSHVSRAFAEQDPSFWMKPSGQ